MRPYNGYLLPYLSRVQASLAAGCALMQVVRELHDVDGVRPPFSGPEHNPNYDRARPYNRDRALRTMWAVLKHALKSYANPDKPTRPVWQVWTPEMQALELAAERRGSQQGGKGTNG